MIFDCDCSVDVDGPTTSWVNWRVAQKEHTCGECHEPIRPGQRYEIAKGVWEYEFRSFKTCEVCVRIRERFCPYGFVYGKVQDAVAECVGFRYAEDPATWEDDEE